MNKYILKVYESDQIYLSLQVTLSECMKKAHEWCDSTRLVLEPEWIKHRSDQYFTWIHGDYSFHITRLWYNSRGIDITDEVETWMEVNNICLPFTPEQQVEFALQWL